jgi:hypothetical protein
MSLTKPPVITPEELAANQANARRSRGPATPEGRERTWKSPVRHGCHSWVPMHQQLRFVAGVGMKFKSAGSQASAGRRRGRKSSEYPTISFKTSGLKIGFGDIPRYY